MDRTIAFVTLGCKLNYAETSTYERGFRAHGFTVVPSTGRADVYLVNTCAVTTHSENKCRNLIRRCHRTNPDALVVVTGCYAQLQREQVSALEGVGLVFGAREKTHVVSGTVAYLEGGATQAAPVREAAMPGRSTPTLAAYSTGERTRSFLKVQDGCDNLCAYCTVPFARGASRNLPVSDIVSQAREIARGGVREIVLTGVNTGDFGKSTGESFLDLLAALSKVEGIARYRISSVEPNLLTDQVIDFLASEEVFQPHFHIPLQSGSDDILRSMGRRYDTALFASRIDYIRKAFERPGRPLVFFGIDVIAGLPGEDQARWKETYDFLEQVVRPAFIHIFPYSPRPGTRAAAMPGQVQDGVKTRRVAEAEALRDRLGAEFAQMNRGLRSTVLWESTCRDGMMEGYTGNYLRMARPFDPRRVGTLEDVVIDPL